MPKACGLLIALAALAASGVAEARPGSVRIEITSRAPAYGGKSFGDRGAYETITGIANMRIDPADPANRSIVDLALAPRGSDGLVAYDVDLIIMRPREATRARRVLLYDVVNRGVKLMSM